MPILLPIAGITTNFAVVIAIGVVIGLLSGLLGVGGGFLLTPILMMIGVPPTVAAASGTNAIVATSSSGMAAHFRLRNVDLRMGTILLSGGLAGSGVGVHFVRILRSMGNADFAIEITYILMLGFVGGYIVRDSWRKMRQGQMANPRRGRSRSRGLLSNLPAQMEFPHSGVRHSVFVPFILCALVGILAAIMGVGGGFIMVPMMVYLLRMPMHVAVGTDLFQILFTCAGVTLMQAAANHTVDIVLALLVAIGSTVGAQVGARLVRLLRGEQLRIVLASIVLATAAKMTLGLLVEPASLLAGLGGN